MRYTENITKWVKLGDIHSIKFVGRDAVCIAQGCHFIFINLLNHEEKLFRADNTSDGEGVKCFTGHQSIPMFAFAEKCSNPSIFIYSYPEFHTIFNLLDGCPEGYKALTFSETSALLSLGELPFFNLIVWNWRNGTKIASIETDIFCSEQILRCNAGNPVFIAQLSVEKSLVNIWDVGKCGTKCILTKHRIKVESNTPSFTSVLWTSEGSLFILDSLGNAHMVRPDNTLECVIKCLGTGSKKTTFSWYKAGIIIAGPDEEVRHYRKSGTWLCDWWCVHSEAIVQLISSPKDHLIALTEKGNIVEYISTENIFEPIKVNESYFNDICLIYPTGEFIVTLSHGNELASWDMATGKLVDIMPLQGKALAMTENPEYPYVGLAYSHGLLELVSAYNPNKLTSMTSFRLTKNPLSQVYFTEIGKLIVTADMNVGQFFVIEGVPGTKMQVLACVDANVQIADYILVASRTCLRLFALCVTSPYFIAGNCIVRFCIIKGKAKADRKEYYFEDPDALYSELCATTKYNRDRVFYAIPLNSKYIHEIETKRADAVARVLKTINTGHQMNKLHLRIDKNYVVTCAFDGLVIIRSLDFKTDFGIVMPHHRMDGGAVKAYVDPLAKHVISLGRDNTLVCTQLIKSEMGEEEHKEELRSLLTTSRCTLMFHRKTIGFMPTGDLADKTWLEVEAIKNRDLEQEECLLERNKILAEFELIQQELQRLLTKNLEGPENEYLDMQEFNLDEGLKAERILESKLECQETKVYLEDLILGQDKVTDWLKELFWVKMSTPGKKICAVFASFDVENYCLLPIDGVEQELIRCIIEYRKIEELMAKEDTFMPWIPKTNSELKLQLGECPKLMEEEPAVNIIEAMKEEESSVGDLPDEETLTAFCGSLAHIFVTLEPGHYTQGQIQTFYQLQLQSLLSANENYKLKEHFNKQFEDMLSQKTREMNNVVERNSRLRHIISEINYFSVDKLDIIVNDPEWLLVENPELLAKVDNKEVGITPYISPSEQAILDAQAAEAERIRLLLLADDFRERALMAMMNGVLEIRWEDELKKDVPKPKCMLEKEPETFNEEDLRNVRDYEEKVKFLISERERYKKMLENEYGKLGNVVRESIRKFNIRLADLLLLKIKIDSAINQEKLKINRMRLINHKRIVKNEKEDNAKKAIINNEKEIEVTHKLITSLYEALVECRNYLDVLQAKEKVLERGFKKDFLEANPVVQELTLKLYKKRPKTNVRTVTSITMMIEVSRCVITHEQSIILSQECIDFLRAMDSLDSYIGVPSAVDENVYAVVCRHRRLKIENELKIKAATMEILEAESTIAGFQKVLAHNKEAHTKLMSKLDQIRNQKLHYMQDVQLQLVLREGFVELPTTGKIEDFDEALMIPRKEVEDINKIIVKSGNRKLKAMRDAMNFRRGILIMEWEHQQLKMRITDLITYVHYIEGVKVTKEIQAYLKSRARGESPDKGLSFEREVEMVKASYERMIEDRKAKVKELQQRINCIKRENEILDKQIINVNVDVCEYKLEKDDALEKREKDIIKIRMTTLLKRAKLIKQIQDNHSEILVSQTELEILRLKTFPTLKYKIFT